MSADQKKDFCCTIKSKCNRRCQLHSLPTNCDSHKIIFSNFQMAGNVFVGLRIDKVRNNSENHKGRGLCLLRKPNKTNQGLEDSRTRATTVLDKTFYFADRELRMRVSFKKKKKKNILIKLGLSLTIIHFK